MRNIRVIRHTSLEYSRWESADIRKLEVKGKEAALLVAGQSHPHFISLLIIATLPSYPSRTPDRVSPEFSGRPRRSRLTGVLPERGSPPGVGGVGPSSSHGVPKHSSTMLSLPTSRKGFSRSAFPPPINRKHMSNLHARGRRQVVCVGKEREGRWAGGGGGISARRTSC
jgi:hypothetical protein